jgi:hypothetical protein
MRNAIKITNSPTEAGSRGPTRSVRWPARMARPIVSTGAERKSSPMNVAERCSTSCR